MARNAPFIDQRGQHVGSMYIAAGDINIGAAVTQRELVDSLRKVREAAMRASKEGLISGEQAIDADYHLNKAVNEASKAQPDKSKLTTFLSMATDVVKGVASMAGFVETLNKCIQKVNAIPHESPHFPW